MRRRKLLVALAGLAVVGVAGAVVLWTRANCVTGARFEASAGFSQIRFLQPMPC
jgi:hypothetical protein